MHADLPRIALAGGVALLLALALHGHVPMPAVPIAAPARLSLALVPPSFDGPANAPLQVLPPERPIATERDAVAPPPAGPWIRLLDLADEGDPHAACDLAVMLEECRIAADVGAMVETQISIAASMATDADMLAADAHQIAALLDSTDPLQATCSAIPPGVAARGWTYLLRAAIAGHEPSMYRFVVDLPLDPERPDADPEALAAYRDNAPLFVGLLLQRASPQALALAFRAAQGTAFVGDRPLQPRDPAAVVRLGTALVALRGPDATSEESVEHALTELPPAVSLQARADGWRLAERFLRDLDVALPPSQAAAAFDECSAGWPGMESQYTAYSY